jgi:hypothetical protein
MKVVPKNKQLKKKKKQKFSVKIKKEIELDVLDVLGEAIEQYGAKLVLKYMASYCYLNYIHYTHTMAAFLADEKKIENSLTGQILLYVLKNWDKMSKDAENYISKRMDEVDRKSRLENNRH